MSSQDVEDVKNSSITFEKGARVSVLGGDHTGSNGVITQVDKIVYILLDNGVHVRGPYTQFKLIK